MKIEDGKIYSCGNNWYGQLGFGDTKDRSTFEEVTLLKNEKIISISCGGEHCIALTGLYFYFKFIQIEITLKKMVKFIHGDTIIMDNWDWGKQQIKN